MKFDRPVVIMLAGMCLVLLGFCFREDSVGSGELGVLSLRLSNVRCCVGALIALTAFALWENAAVLRRYLWALYAGFILTCLCCCGYLLYLEASIYHWRNPLTWFDEQNVLLPIMNVGIPTGVLALCGLGVLAWRSKERPWRLLVATGVLGAILFFCLGHGAGVYLRDLDWSLSPRVWWLRG